MDISSRLENFTKRVNDLEVEQRASIKTKERLLQSIQKIVEESDLKQDELETVTNAISILRIVSDNSVKESYEYITSSVNAALERIFEGSHRSIRLEESTLKGQYPQLEVILEVGNGVERSLKFNSGHGLTQVISLLCIITIIVITKSRRILVMDEILSGLSDSTREIIADIMWTFTDIGFQFVVCEHGFIPKGAYVYELKNVNDTGVIDKQYYEENGVYLITNKQS